jgi:hypothetical protein
MFEYAVRPDRRTFIGGSDARIIMGDDEVALLRLWRQKRGEVEPDDLSGNLIVQLGLATEALNGRWYEANTGQAITDVQRQVRHPALRWMAATLDGEGPVWLSVEPHTRYPFFNCRFRNRTPGPPPFSSMNSTPARFRTPAIAASVAASPAYLPVSMLVIVLRWSWVASARSRTVHFNAARAIRTCALVTGIILCHCHMCRCHNIEATILVRLPCHTV